MVKRTVEQKACDRLLLLWLIDKSPPFDSYKLHKLPFKSEYEPPNETGRIFSFEFIQYDEGPLSVDAYEDRDALEESSLITVKGYFIEITPVGKRLLSRFSSIIESNHPIFERLSRIAKRYIHVRGAELVDETHKMRILWNGRETAVEDIPRLSTILPRPDGAICHIGLSTLETMIVYLNPDLLSMLQKVRREGSSSSPYVPISVP